MIAHAMFIGGGFLCPLLLVVMLVVVAMILLQDRDGK